MKIIKYINIYSVIVKYKYMYIKKHIYINFNFFFKTNKYQSIY